MDPGPQQPFLLKFRDSRVDCRPWNACLVGYVLEVSETILSHRCDDLDVLFVQEGDESVDPFQVFLRRDLAQVWLEEESGWRELFNVLPTLELFLELGGLRHHC